MDCIQTLMYRRRYQLIKVWSFSMVALSLKQYIAKRVGSYIPKNSDLSNWFGLGETAVASFTLDLLGKNDHVHFDYYFSSIPLMEHLKTNGILACATMRPNRTFLATNSPTQKSLKRGEYDFRASSQRIVYFKWMDHRAVHLLPNC